MIQIFKEHNMHGFAFIASVLLAIRVVHNIKGATGVIYVHLRNPIMLYTIAASFEKY